MTLKRVRPVAICLVYRETEKGPGLFVMEGFDKVKSSWFYRPLGGGIEFGERGYQTVEREFLEELGQELTEVRFLCALENLFTYDGAQGHELVLVYTARFADEVIYEMEVLEATEDDGSRFTALWKPLADFQRGRSRLVPEGLLEHLAKPTTG